jgi:soluble lytic murein transglycosylase-like protein
MPARQTKPWLCSLALVLITGPAAQLGTQGSRRSPQAIEAAAREQVELALLRSLVHEHRRSADESWRERLVEVIHRESTVAGVDPLFVAAIVASESSFRSAVVSRAGAVGLMQLRPFVARDLALRSDLEWREGETLRHPESNVRLGVSYFSELVRRFDGDPSLALAAYHRGPTRLERELRGGVYSGSRYARRVLELYDELDARRRGLLERS